jgi:hypothetical protein
MIEKEKLLETIEMHFAGRFTPLMAIKQFANDTKQRYNYQEFWTILRQLKTDGSVKQISKGWYEIAQ